MNNIRQFAFQYTPLIGGVLCLLSTWSHSLQAQGIKESFISLHKEIIEKQYSSEFSDTLVLHKLMEEFSGAYRLYKDSIAVPLDKLYTFQSSKIAFHLNLNREKSFYNYQYSRWEIVDYYSNLKLEAELCLNKAETMIKVINQLPLALFPVQNAPQTYLFKDINFLKRQITYFNIRINDQLSTVNEEIAPPYAEYQKKQIPLFTSTEKNITRPNSFVTTDISNEGDNVQFITGYLSTPVKRIAFVAKLKRNKVEWLKKITAKDEEETIGYFIEATNNQPITKVKAISLTNPTSQHRNLILELSPSNGKVLSTIEENDIDADFHEDIFIFKENSVNSLIIGKGIPSYIQPPHKASTTVFDNVYVKNINSKGSIIWEKDIRLEGSVVDVIKTPLYYTLICNAAYAGGNAEASPQVANRIGDKEDPTSLLIVLVNKKNGDVTYKNTNIYEPLEITHISKTPKDEYILSGKDLRDPSNKPNELFTILFSSEFDVLYSSL